MKDLLQSIEGEPFSWGWKPFKDAKMAAPLTSYVAAKFRAAGLITLAQSTVPEWGATLSTESRAWGRFPGTRRGSPVDRAAARPPRSLRA
jgi:amidase